METKHLYEVALSWDADRRGTLSSPVLNNIIEVATPPQFPGGMPGIWSPEHLFVAAINSCLMTTFLSIAGSSKLDFKSFTSNAIGKLEQVDGKYIVSEVTLSPVVTISDPKVLDRTNRILQKSEEHCLISNSVKSKIVFAPEVRVLGERIE